jgi:hypothetical protein
MAVVLGEASIGLLSISPPRLLVGGFSHPLVATCGFQVAEIRGSVHQLTLIRNSVCALMWSAKNVIPKFLWSCLLANVPRCVRPYAKTLGLQHLQLPDVVASSRSPDRTCIIHYRTDELLVEQHTVSDGQAASPVKEVTNHALSLGCHLSYLVDLCRPGKPCIKGHPKILCSFDPPYWLFEKLDWLRLFDASRSPKKEHSRAFWDVASIPPIP